MVGCTEALAARLAAGRTVGMLAALLDTRVFQFDTCCDDAPSLGISMLPRRGLQATFEGRPVFILDTFTRYRQPYADVVDIEHSDADAFQPGSTYTLGKLCTCTWDKLHDVRCEFLVSKANDRGVTLERITGPEDLSSFSVSYTHLTLPTTPYV